MLPSAFGLCEGSGYLFMDVITCSETLFPGSYYTIHSAKIKGFPLKHSCNPGKIGITHTKGNTSIDIPLEEKVGHL